MVNLPSYEECIRDCETALSLNPNYSKGYGRLGLSYMALGEYQRSLDSYKKALIISPDNIELLNELEKCKQIINIEGKYKKAVDSKNVLEQKQYLKILIATSFKAKRFRLASYMLSLEEGDYNDAQSQLISLKDLYPMTDLYYLKANMLYRQGELAAALSLVQDVLKSDPDHKDCQQLRKLVKKLNVLKEEANEAFKAGKYEEAIDKYNKCLEVPNVCKGYMAVVYTNKATAFTKLNKYKDALKELDKAIECNEKYPQAFYKRGDANRKLKNFDSAIRDMQAAQDLDHDKYDLRDEIKKIKIEEEHSKKKDYYAILGVSNDATEAEIKKAYRQLALKWHPDRARLEDKDKSEKMFKEIGEAYGVLSDKEKKRRYDMGQDPEGQSMGSGGVNPFDIFNVFFSRGGNDEESSGAHFGFPGFTSFGGRGGRSNFTFKFG